MAKAFYITTPIYYVNDVPHIGSAYTTLSADILARFVRMRGRKVFFATGTDENAPKVAEAAREKGRDPQEFCDEMSEAFRQTWSALNIAYDAFIRTTEKRHAEVVRQFLKKLVDKGLVYEDFYRGWYCIYEETYFREEEVKEGVCPNPECGRPLQKVSERGYFFRLSAFQEPLFEFVSEEGRVLPDFRQREVLSFIQTGLRDIYITRVRNEWGILFPGDENLRVYVWVDALINYLTVAGYLQDEEVFKSIWPPDVQLMGKDILVRFHATLWPAMLMASGLPLPSLLFGHGFWTVNGEKMSKSKGNVVHPVQAVKEIQRLSGAEERFAVDALRFYLFRTTPFGQDGDFSFENLKNTYNADLANDIGNLLTRISTMVERFLEGKIPDLLEDWGEEVNGIIQSIASHMENLRFHQAIEEALRLIDMSNKHIDTTAPWRLHKEGNLPALERSLGTALELLKLASLALYPFMPSACREILWRIGWEKEPSWEDMRWGSGYQRTKIQRGEMVFPRAKEVIEVREERGKISIEEFGKVDLRIGRIVSCSMVEGTDKLLQMEVDLGEMGKRRTVAGIAKYYSPQELIGKTVVFVANLAPAMIRGHISEGMVLAVDSPQGVVLVTPEKEVPPGSKVR